MTLAPLPAVREPAPPGMMVAARIFLVFAFAYFLSALLRAVTATLAPVFSRELGLAAADLGLLAGAYFLGFAALQLPLGSALDRHGPRRTLLALMAVAVLGCAAFALAGSLASLFVARVLIGAGVAACLMAPLTCYRRLFDPAQQMRANSWMLMTGSLGMLASTVPVQALLPLIGWRGLFWVLAAALALAWVLIAAFAPRDSAAANPTSDIGPGAAPGYRHIAATPLFRALAPLAFFHYGGMIAVQALWAGPWFTQVGGMDAAQAARGLFVVNAAMGVAFALWGVVTPRLLRRGVSALDLVRWGLPLSFALLALNLVLGASAGPWHWAAWCVACTFVTLTQPAVGAAFPPHLAGRALSAFNLVIFAGIFAVQWGLGLLIDAIGAEGAVAEPDAFRLAFAALGVAGLVSYGIFLRDFARLRRSGE